MRGSGSDVDVGWHGSEILNQFDRRLVRLVVNFTWSLILPRHSLRPLRDAINKTALLCIHDKRYACKKHKLS